MIFRNNAGTIEKRALRGVTAQMSGRQSPLAYRELGGQEWLLEAPTEADYARIEVLRHNGHLALGALMASREFTSPGSGSRHRAVVIHIR